jgi:hypothetical protein
MFEFVLTNENAGRDARRASLLIRERRNNQNTEDKPIRSTFYQARDALPNLGIASLQNRWLASVYRPALSEDPKAKNGRLLELLARI